MHSSLKGYTKKALKQFSHKQKKKLNQPYPSVPIKYGAKNEYTMQPSSAPCLDKKGTKFIQQVCGNSLFQVGAVDSTLLCPISAITSQSVNPTEENLKQTQ